MSVAKGERGEQTSQSLGKQVTKTCNSVRTRPRVASLKLQSLCPHPLPSHTTHIYPRLSGRRQVPLALGERKGGAKLAKFNQNALRNTGMGYSQRLRRECLPQRKFSHGTKQLLITKPSLVLTEQSKEGTTPAPSLRASAAHKAATARSTLSRGKGYDRRKLCVVFVSLLDYGTRDGK